MTDEPTPATKDRLGDYDAIQTAKPGEPLFPIQGGDPHGPATVQFWVDRVRREGMAETDRKKSEALLRKASDAERIGWQMIDYQRGTAPKDDDEPDSGRQTFTGWSDESDEDTKLARRQRSGRIRAAGRLHNAIAAATEAADTLGQLRVCPEAEVKVREALESIREAALDVEPRRGRERT